MSFKFQLPPITSETGVDKLRSYLMQMTEQLEYALNNLETANFTESSQKEITKNSEAVAQATTDASVEVLKAMIVKNAEVIEQQMDSMEQNLHGEYTALSSQFGTYREETDNKIEANANAITQNYTDVQTLIGETNDNLSATQSQVDAQDAIITETSRWETTTKGYIKSGLLYYEGLTPIYGIAIGQITIDENDPEECMLRQGFYATYTGKDIIFYKGTTEVARYSDIEAIVNQLNTNKIIMGDFTISVGSDGLTIK